MSVEKKSKASQTGLAVACVAAVGAAVAVAVWFRAARQTKPRVLMDRCLRTIDDLEQRVLTAAQA